MKIDFHLHSNGSKDCKSDPNEILRWASQKGLEALAVTDHDTIERFEEFVRLGQVFRIRIIPAIETTVLRGTHYLVYFTPDLPLPFDDMDLIDEVHRRGGLVGIAHPYRSDTGLIYNKERRSTYDEDEVDRILNSADLIEIANAKSPARENQMAMSLGLQYPNLQPIGGSDSHHPASVGAMHVDIRGQFNSRGDSLTDACRSNPRVIITLPEMQQTCVEKAVRGSIEGARKLMVAIKPLIPTGIWRAGKTIYASRTDQYEARRAKRSLVGR